MNSQANVLPGHRIIMAETDDRGQSCFIAFPHSSTPLPLDWDRDEMRRHLHSAAPTLTTPYSVPVGSMGRQAQAVSLLDEVLRAIRSTYDDKDIRLSECGALDTRIRDFLTIIVGQNERKESSMASSIGLAVRCVEL